METVHIDRLHARYRLTPSRRAEVPRLDAVLAGMLERELERALGGIGSASGREEVCLHSLEVPVHLRLSATDGALAEAWSASLAASVAEAVRQGGPDVVHYRSRAHALIDVAMGVASGDYRRAWAWEQLGLWRAGPRPSDGDAGHELLLDFLSAPTLVVAVVAAVADRGALEPLVRTMPERWWTAVSVAAFEAGAGDERSQDPSRPARGSHPAVLSSAPLSDSGGAAAADRAPPGAAVALRMRAARIVDDGRIGRAASRMSFPSGNTELRRALARLALLEMEPAVAGLGGATVRTLLDAIDRTLEAASATAAAGDLADSATPAARDLADGAGPAPPPRPTAPGVGEASTGRLEVYDAALPAAADVSREQLLSADAGPARSETTLSPWAPTDPSSEPVRNGAGADIPSLGRTGEDGKRRRVRDAPRGDLAEPLGSQPRDLVEQDPAGGASEEHQARGAATKAGGLLFLLHVVAQLGLPSEILSSEVFAARSLRWVLHRLASSLAPVAPADPAALAFCGLPPTAARPDQAKPEASEEEAAGVTALGTRVVVALAERMGWSGAGPEGLLRGVCLREAVVIADPGWIELRLAASEVSIPVRRAGLDLDPGWVPWLGVVVRFVYE